MRRLCKNVTIYVLGLLLFTFLGSVGFAYLTTPLREPSASPWFQVTRLSSLPDNGEPQLLKVWAPQRDAWARLPDRALGSIFVRRVPETGEVIALRPEHHGGLHIPVVYDAHSRLFRSRCWLVAFDLDGNEVEENGHRIGDRLKRVPVIVRGDTVWVHYVVAE